MGQLVVNNHIIDTPVIDILHKLKSELTNGKLAVIEQKGSQIRVTCPNKFHKNGCEGSPDCEIYLGDDEKIGYTKFHCFSCNVTGFLPEFVALTLECSIDYAKLWLVRNFGGEEIHTRVLDLPEMNLFQKNETKYIDEKVLDSFQSWHPYMAVRKLTPEIANKFQVKYDPQTKCLVFPVRDINGHLVSLNRRSVEGKKFIIDKNAKKPVYLLDYIKRHNITKCLITEGQLDCLASWSYGFPAIATLGSISEEQIEDLKHSGIRILLTGFDADSSGQKFTQIINNELGNKCLVLNAEIPGGKKDINELTKEEFSEMIKKVFTN